MKKWFQQFLSVSINSFTVLMSDPLVLIMHIFIIGVTLMIACLPGFTLGGQLKLVRDQAMALSFISGCLLAAVGTARLISEDIRNGMLPTIMSRPVSYSALLSGKWAGLVSSLLMIFISATVSCLWASRIIKQELHIETLGLAVYLIVVIATLLIVAIRHYYKGGNYMWQANLTLFVVFLLSFLIINFWGYNGMQSEYGFLVDWRSSLAYIYVFLALLVFSAAVSFFAVLMDVSMLLTFSAVLFFGGLFSGYLINLISPEGFLNSLLNTLIPNWQTFWISEVISSPQVSGLSFFLPRLISALLQSLMFLIIGTFFFERKEITGSV
jgi:hypothetical protein